MWYLSHIIYLSKQRNKVYFNDDYSVPEDQPAFGWRRTSSLGEPTVYKIDGEIFEHAISPNVVICYCVNYSFPVLQAIVWFVYNPLSYEFTTQRKICWNLTLLPRKDNFAYIACWIYRTRIWSGLGMIYRSPVLIWEVVSWLLSYYDHLMIYSLYLTLLSLLLHFVL